MIFHMRPAWVWNFPCPEAPDGAWTEYDLTPGDLAQLPKEPATRPADSGRLRMNPVHLPCEGGLRADQEPAISPERR